MERDLSLPSKFRSFTTFQAGEGAEVWFSEDPSLCSNLLPSQFSYLYPSILSKNSTVSSIFNSQVGTPFDFPFHRALLDQEIEVSYSFMPSLNLVCISLALETNNNSSSGSFSHKSMFLPLLSS